MKQWFNWGNNVLYCELYHSRLTDIEKYSIARVLGRQYVAQCVGWKTEQKT